MKKMCHQNKLILLISSPHLLFDISLYVLMLVLISFFKIHSPDWDHMRVICKEKIELKDKFI